MNFTILESDASLLLELLNSTPITDGVQQDLLGTRAIARAQLIAWGGTGTASEWAAIRDVRGTLQSIVRGETSPAELAAHLAEASYLPVSTDQGIDWALEAPASQRLAVRAALAWDALRRTAPGRLRPCENPDCALFLVDRSKPNTARWCSMAVCGNRMKARRHYERSRATTTRLEA